MAARSGSALCSCLSRAVYRTPAGLGAPAVAPSASTSSKSRQNVRHRRTLHTRPQLPYDVSEGVQPLLSPAALRGTAVDWHQGCLDRLNDLTRGTKFENQSVANTVISASKERQDAMTFGYASEALNNGFFLSCLKPATGQVAEDSPEHSKDIKKAINKSFGSMTSFINYFSSYANGMFGTGYVWLVMDSVDNLAVLATYGSGTVLVQGDRIRAPEQDFLPGQKRKAGSAANAPSNRANKAAVEAAQQAIGHETERQPTREYENEASSQPASSGPGASSSPFGQPRGMHTSAVQAATTGAPAPGPAETYARSSYLPASMGKNVFSSAVPRRQEPKRFLSIHPIFCLSLHPHVYIPDYGVWGKEKYIQNFWKSVDWAKANERYRGVREIYGGNVVEKDPVIDDLLMP